MTRKQVRAAMRRMRDHVEEAEEENGELNLVPYMDIVTNIIIFLLASVVYNVELRQRQRHRADPVAAAAAPPATTSRRSRR